MDNTRVSDSGVRVYIPILSARVIPDLNAFLVVLSRLTERDQLDILDQATTQIAEQLDSEGGK